MAHGIIAVGLFVFSMQQFLVFMKILLTTFIIAGLLAFSSCDSTTTGKNPENPSNTEATTSTGKPDSLLEAINKRIADSPNNYVNYLERAQYFGNRENYKLAFEDISRAMTIDSTRADIYLYKGELFFNQEKVKEAYEEYKNCLRFDAVNQDCLLKKAGIDIVLENYDLAREHINEALKQNEYNAYAYYLRGRMYKAQRDTATAASSYKTAIEVDPDYYDAYIEVGLLYAAQKNDLAKEYYNSAIDIKPRSIEAWYDKAMFLQETGSKRKDKYQEAFACYDTILHIDPGFIAAHFNKGFIWLEYLQKYDSAEVEFSKAITKYPSYYQAYYNRGLCYESLNRKKDAEADYRQALQLEPQYSDAARALDRLLRN